MDTITKLEIGRRLRRRRENAGYTRERLGELCSLSPRFIANIELGAFTLFSTALPSLRNIYYRILHINYHFIAIALPLFALSPYPGQ